MEKFISLETHKLKRKNSMKIEKKKKSILVLKKIKIETL
jgi:hypothetical protein